MHTWVDSERIEQFINDCAGIAEMSSDIRRYVYKERAKETTATPVRQHLPYFRYSYLPRLLDDSELIGLDGGIWRETRRVHRACFWKDVSLLSRDAGTIFRNHRRLMADEGNWDFSDLTRSSLRTATLIFTLRAAYIMHFMRLPAHGIHSAIAELSSILLPLVLVAPAPVVGFPALAETTMSV